MALVRTFIQAAPEDIFNVLSNPNAYEHWVVGCQTIRDADVGFPAPLGETVVRRLRPLAEREAH